MSTKRRSKEDSIIHYNWGVNDALADMRNGNSRPLYYADDAKRAIARNVLPLFAVNELVDADYFAGYRAVKIGEVGEAECPICYHSPCTCQYTDVALSQGESI